MIGDEILGVLTGILSTQDNAGSTLNKVWAGEGVNLRYKSATSLNIRRSSSTIYGMIHPTDLCDVLKSWQTGTGFLDRWLIVAVNDLAPDYLEGSNARKNWRKPQINMTSFFAKLYDYFNDEENPEDFKFVFSRESQELIAELSKDLKSMKQLHNAKLETEGISAGSSPFLSKIEDNAQKLAMLFHILFHGVESIISDGTLNIPLVIPSSTVKKAISFIKKSADTTKIFKNGISDISSKPDFSFELTPGKFLTCRIYNEAHTCKKGFTRLSESDFVSKSTELVETDLGTFVQKIHLKTGEKTVNVFYKKPPNTMNKNILFKKGIIPTEYDTSYNASFKLSPSKEIELRQSITVLSAHNPYNRAHINSKRTMKETEKAEEEEDGEEFLHAATKRKITVPYNINYYLSSSDSGSNLSSTDSESL